MHAAVWAGIVLLFSVSPHNPAVSLSNADEYDDENELDTTVGDASFSADTTSSNQFKFGSTTNDKASSVTGSSETKLSDIVVIVQSQQNSYHLQRAEEQNTLWQEQFDSLQDKPHKILRIHEDWAPRGAWTIFPLIPQLVELSAKWYLFCEDETLVNFGRLIQLFDQYKPNKKFLLGRGLRDVGTSIIHHFAFWEDASKAISYPHFVAGWAVSRALIKKFAKRLESRSTKMDFSIDVQHEIAMFLYNDGKGTRMTSLPEFCVGTKEDDSTQCVTNYPSSLRDCVRHLKANHNLPVVLPRGLFMKGKVPLDKIFIAVKTTKSYHSRLDVIKRTWNRDDLLVTFFSNVTDSSIPTEDTGVPNVERGHCSKSYAILEKAHSSEKYTGVQWTLLVDDDTLLSIGHLQRLLACYDPEEVTFLGEVYGYGQSNGYGYPYITLGGGMAVSRAGLQAWQHVAKKCPCPSLETPDDMWIGSCLNREGIPLTHRSEFHQARAQDYSPQYLEHQTSVSFHRHRDVDLDRLYQNELSDK